MMDDMTWCAERDLSAACNLLAVMHGDGGHHTAKVGFAQSCDDAREARHALVDEVARLRAQGQHAVCSRALADAEAEVKRLQAKLAEALKNNDAASYPSMLYWREKCYEARAEIERLREREVDVARALGALGENRVDLPRIARNVIAELQMQYRTMSTEAEVAISEWKAEVERLRAFAKRLLIVHEMRDEKTAEAILESVLRGEMEKS